MIEYPYDFIILQFTVVYISISSKQLILYRKSPPRTLTLNCSHEKFSVDQDLEVTAKFTEAPNRYDKG